MMEKLPVYFSQMYYNPNGYKIMREFQKFLLENKIWKEFLQNLNESLKQFGHDMKITDPRFFIFNAFSWVNANDTVDWHAMDRKWGELCYKKMFKGILVTHQKYNSRIIL